MEKKGFTLIELLGVIIVLAIVMGLAVVSYVNINGSGNTAYYKTLEESLRMAGGDYFNYNKGKQPKLYGDEEKVTAKELEDGKYLNEEVKDAKGNPCNTEKSYVGAYKDSADKTDYYVCLNCEDYQTDSLPCNGILNYTLGVTASKKDSKDIYKPDGKSWSNEDIVLTFETLNDMKEVYLVDKDGNNIGSCNIQKKGDVGSCQITVSESGVYEAYAKNGEAETRKKELNILIDKTLPSFEYEYSSSVIEVEVDSNKYSKVVTNTIKNINDPDSSIKTIEYSFEKEGSKDIYYKIDNTKTSFTVSKELSMGIHYLKVRVYNNAGLKSESEIKYIVWKRIVPPTSSKCNNPTYNGSSQTLASGAGEGYSFVNNSATYAGSYTVSISLAPNYRDIGGPSTITCSIGRRSATISARAQTITYGETITTGTSAVTTSGIASGDYLSSVTVTPSTSNATTSGTISVSGAVISRGGSNMNSNYNISYSSATLVINRARTATTGSCDNTLTYKAKAQTLASGGNFVSYSPKEGIEVGSYPVTVTADSNHLFSDGAETKTLNCKIDKQLLEINMIIAQLVKNVLIKQESTLQ